MPAVTTENLAVLPKVRQITLTDRIDRAVETRTTAPSGFEGEGFPVRRAFHGISHQALDPFIHMDQMGEVNYSPGEPKGTPWHPHRGFETVTYMIDGTMVHQDSHGGGGLITDGDTQWMTAGRGILHIETPPEALVISGGLFHGIQLWVNLPAAEKMIAPEYQSVAGSEISLIVSDDGASLIRLIAGSLGNLKGPGNTHTPINMIHATIAPGSRIEMPWPERFNGLAYVLAGSGFISDARVPLGVGQLATTRSGNTLTVYGSDNPNAEPLEILLLGGEPIGDPVVAHGPFVMNTRAQIIQAVSDYEAGRLGVIPPGAIGIS